MEERGPLQKEQGHHQVDVEWSDSEKEETYEQCDECHNV